MQEATDLRLEDIVSEDDVQKTGIHVDKKHEKCVNPVTAFVGRGQVILWYMDDPDEESFEIHFEGGSPCANWRGDRETSTGRTLTCAIPADSPTGPIKYAVRIGSKSCDPIVWVV